MEVCTSFRFIDIFFEVCLVKKKKKGSRPQLSAYRERTRIEAQQVKRGYTLINVRILIPDTLL